MPPWPAERGFGTFSNDIGLTPREFEFLISWIDGGVPRAPTRRRIRRPRRALDARHARSRADADGCHDHRSRARRPSFTRITIDTGLTRDAWLRGFDFKPDARVTRAAFFSVAGTDRYLGGWTPWQSSTELPDGRRIQDSGTRANRH